MRILVLIFLLWCSSLFHAQHYYFGDLQTNYLLESQVYRSDSNTHTGVKPYNFHVLIKNNLSDSVFQKGIWDNAEIFSERKLRFLPVVDFQFKNFSLYNQKNYLSSGLGFQVNTELNERMSFQGRYLYNGGKIDDYYLKVTLFLR